MKTSQNAIAIRFISRFTHTAVCLSLLLAEPSPLSAAPTAPPDAITADGGRYYGPLVDGKRHGRGRIEWSNGARYEGEFSQGLYSSKGRLQLPGGDVYEGAFNNGMMSGKGRMAMTDGSVYVGEFRKDDFNGQGRYETPDGEAYEGAFEHSLYHGRGKLTAPDYKYQGDFKRGQYEGQGELTYKDGRKYRGAFVRGLFHGKGRFEDVEGDVYEGDFNKGEFTGVGVHSRDGSRFKGAFLNWRLHGKGSFTDAAGNQYEGEFDNGDLSGPGQFTGKDGGVYKGEFKQWRFHGQGELRSANGDIYKGGFAHGVYDGEGVLTYGKHRPDGRAHDKGVWRYGVLENKGDAQKTKLNVETALYNQRRLLDQAFAALLPDDPKKIDLYLLAIAGDGGQEVFRREVDFVRDQFERDFGVRGRSLTLVNSRNTVESAPMATITSIRESLKVIAARMNKEKDILFLFLTSHGSKTHEFSLDQNGMDLRSLSAKALGDALKESDIRWKVIVVSACYAGGFINAVKDDYTLVITAARHDRPSFGCSDNNDFTYFGRAFFKESLSPKKSFQQAFRKAEALVKTWEAKELKADGESEKDGHSLPQMHNPPRIQAHLKRWQTQSTADRR